MSYGYQQKARGTNLREKNGEAEQNIYVQERADVPLTGGDDEKEPMVSIQLTTLTEKPDEEAEIFSNKAATDPDKEMSLSDDIAKELNEETQTLKISFDDPGEETKL